MSDEEPGRPVLVGAEPVEPHDPERLVHLTQNRSLVVKRSLLATALGGFIPLPVMDDLVAGRVRAGLYVKLAESRQVDLPLAAAEVLAEAREGSALRNATVTAVTLVALKLAWRKIFALLAAGRGAEEMANTFQIATLVDHYCARLHVGGAVTRDQAAELRVAIFASIDQTERAALVATFREGGRTLGRSVLEAPRWLSQKLTEYAGRWAAARRRPGGDGAALPDFGLAEGDGPWLDRAAHAVEQRLAGLGNGYLGGLVDRFEARWRERPPPAAAPGGTAGEPAAPRN